MALRKRSSSHVRSAIVIPWVEILQDDVLVWNKPLWVSCRVFVIAASIAIDSCRVIVHILVEVQRFVILIRRLRKNSSGLRHYNWWQIGSNTQVITRYFDKLNPLITHLVKFLQTALSKWKFLSSSFLAGPNPLVQSLDSMSIFAPIFDFFSSPWCFPLGNVKCSEISSISSYFCIMN